MPAPLPVAGLALSLARYHGRGARGGRAGGGRAAGCRGSGASSAAGGGRGAGGRGSGASSAAGGGRRVVHSVTELFKMVCKHREKKLNTLSTVISNNEE